MRCQMRWLCVCHGGDREESKRERGTHVKQVSNRRAGRETVGVREVVTNLRAGTSRSRVLARCVTG